MPRKSRTSRLNLTIDERLKRQFGALCTLKDLNMSDVAHDLIECWVSENSSPEMLEKLMGQQNDDDSIA